MPFKSVKSKYCNKTTFKKGHKRSLESRLKQAQTMKGRINLLAIEKMNTPEANRKKRNCGNKNGNWLGDRKLLKRPLCSKEGILWRTLVFKRDNYTCQTCGQRGGKLQAHHIVGYFENKDLKWELSNGQTLCVECHKLTDNYGWKSINIRRSNCLSTV